MGEGVLQMGRMRVVLCANFTPRDGLMADGLSRVDLPGLPSDLSEEQLGQIQTLLQEYP